MEKVIIGFVYGFVGGFGNAMSGFVKHAKKEKFGLIKAFKTSLIGGIVGGLTNIGYSLSPEQIGLISFVITDLVENLVKMYRKR